MPAAYIFANVDVNNPQAYAAYRERVPATLEKYGGTFLVRGGRNERLEGQEPYSRVVLLRFPSYEQAKAWYDSQEYAEPKHMRQACSIGNLILMEGTD